MFGKTRGFLSQALMAMAVVVSSFNMGVVTEATSQPAAKMPEKLIVGYLPNEENADDNAKKGREELMKDMSQAIGLPVEVIVLSDYNAVIETMRNGKVQVASFGPFSYIIAHERSSAEAIAVTAKSEKDAVYRSYIIARADSGMKTLEDVKGKSMSFVDPASTSGNLVPRYMLIKEFGIQPKDVDAQFSSVQFAGSHLNSLQAVLNGSVEASAVSSSTIDSAIRKGICKAEDFVILSQSDDIPSSPFALDAKLPEELKTKIVNFFHTYDNPLYFKLRNAEGKKFIPVKDEMYNGVREIADLLDLSPEDLLKN